MAPPAALPQQGSAKETGSTRSGTLEGAALPQVGEQVQVFSRTHGAWLDAEVMSYEMGAAVKLVLRYTIPGVGLVQKRLLRDSRNLRLKDPPQEKPKIIGGSMAATGWAEVEGGIEAPEEEQEEEEEDGEADEDDEADEEEEEEEEDQEEEEEEDDEEEEAEEGEGVEDEAQLPKKVEPKVEEAQPREEKAIKRHSGRRISSRGGELQQRTDENLKLEDGVRRTSSKRFPSRGDDDPPKVDAPKADAPKQDAPGEVVNVQRAEATPGDTPCPQDLVEDTLIASGQFRLHHVIGAGSFSEVRLATQVADDKQVALKLEPGDAKYPQLMDEARRYKMMVGGAGIPKLFWYGQSCGYNIMAMELLGPSLEDMYNRCERNFSLETVIRLADQMLSCVQFIHSRGLIHRDLKPNNFCLGHAKERRAVVHCVDFGLAKRFRLGGEHIPFRTGLPFVGTVRYASLGAQLGNEQGRRDDLQALGYIFLYHLQGCLPWQGVAAASKKERRDLVLSLKQSITVEELCKGAPKEFELYLQYCCDLGFEKEPDYEHLAGLLNSVMAPSSPATKNPTPEQRLSISSAQALEELFDTISSHQ